MQATLTIGSHSRPCTILKSDSVKGYFIQFESQKMWVSKKQVVLPEITAVEIIDQKTRAFDIKAIQDRQKILGALEDIECEIVDALIELTPSEADLLIQEGLS